MGCHTSTVPPSAESSRDQLAACFSIGPAFEVHCRRRRAGYCKMAANSALFDPVLLAEPGECIV